MLIDNILDKVISDYGIVVNDTQRKAIRTTIASYALSALADSEIAEEAFNQFAVVDNLETYVFEDRDFDAVIQKFRDKELNIRDWNFATQKEDGSYSAYIMGEGAEQCLANKRGFKSREEIVDLFKSLGVTYVLSGVG